MPPLPGLRDGAFLPIRPGSPTLQRFNGRVKLLFVYPDPRQSVAWLRAHGEIGLEGRAGKSKPEMQMVLHLIGLLSGCLLVRRRWIWGHDQENRRGPALQSRH
jgi:hypothetical protein